MKTYPLKKEGVTFAFEVDNVYIRTMTIAKLLTQELGVSKIKLRKLFEFNNDNHLEFEYQGALFVVWEPYGDSSRYWIGPKDARRNLPQVSQIEEVFKKHRPWFLRKLFGDLLSLNFKEILRFGLVVALSGSLLMPNGQTAPPEIQSVDAPQLKQIIQKQSRPWILVNYWATWCSPCVKEFPELVELSQKVNIRNAVEFLYVSMDLASQQTEVVKFLKDQKYSATVYQRKGADDPFIKAMAADWQGVLPAIAIYDRKVNLIKLWQGEIDLKMVSQELDALLKKL